MSALSITARGGTTKTLSTDIINEFKVNMRGELITQSDGLYESARKLWNGMIDKKTGYDCPVHRCRRRRNRSKFF
jgi:hypothetical protein